MKKALLYAKQLSDEFMKKIEGQEKIVSKLSTCNE